MAKTATCLYDTEAQAANVVHQLEDAGISDASICMFTPTENNRYWEGTDRLYAGASGDTSDRIVSYLTGNGVPDSDARAYAEGVRRGNALVAVRCDNDEADRVIDILDDDGVLDIDERQAAWRSEGWSGYGADTLGAAGSAGTMATRSTDTLAGARGADTLAGARRADTMAGARGADTLAGARRSETVIPVAEEKLSVGKREVGGGRVRITSHVVERPVQEQVSLTEEHVDVERRPATGDRRMAAGNDDLFRERTIEMEERTEEPVVRKEARVTEEIALRKDVKQRTETVSDTVRKTEVEVEDERGNPISRTGTTDDKR